MSRIDGTWLLSAPSFSRLSNYHIDHVDRIDRQRFIGTGSRAIEGIITEFTIRNRLVRIELHILLAALFAAKNTTRDFWRTTSKYLSTCKRTVHVGLNVVCLPGGTRVHWPDQRRRKQSRRVRANLAIVGRVLFLVSIDTPSPRIEEIIARGRVKVLPLSLPSWWWTPSEQWAQYHWWETPGPGGIGQSRHNEYVRSALFDLEMSFIKCQALSDKKRAQRERARTRKMNTIAHTMFVLEK